MIASELISYDIPPLKLNDTGAKVLDWMEEFKSSDLPVVDENKFLGLINEANILDSNNIDAPLSSYNLDLMKPHVYQQQHLFEVISVAVQNDLTIIPVLGENDEYLGLITSKAIVHAMANMISVQSEGSVIKLEVNLRDYSLAEIAKMVESDDAKVLTSFLSSHPDSKKLEVTLKINKTDVTRILHTFERYNYTVIASYNESDYQKDLKGRYDEFMRFLNI